MVQSVFRLYREARRRKVFRTAALYIVGAWLSLQIADVLFPGFGIPNSAIKVLFWAAVAGLPVAVAFGWLFEIGPGGIRRTAPAEAGEAAEPKPLARRDYLILAAFAAIAALLVYRAAQDVRETPTDSRAAEVARASGERLENSIAVLPFANMSNDPDNEYFCDGISEEILNALAGFRELNVIGRTSSFAFKGSDASIDRISAVLGVRHVLQGSVRKAGNQLRISAQLLDETGRQLWTDTFDRQLANVFDIQSEIAAAVAATVASQVASRAGAVRHPNLAAYDRYLAGRELLHKREVRGALAELQRAIEIDPEFAEAHAEWAIGRLIGEITQEQLDAGRAAIDRALALQPQLLRAQAAQGLWLLAAKPADPARAETILRKVLAQDPNMSDALLWLHNALADQGRSDEALTILQRAARIDPLHPSIAGNFANALAQRGEIEQATRVHERLLEQPNPGLGAFANARDFYQRTGRLVELNTVAKGQALRIGVHHYYYSLALSYSLFGDWVAADYWIERSMRDFPPSPFSPYLPSTVPGWQGRSDDALLRFREALDANDIDIAAQDEWIQAWYGALLARAGEHAAAIEVLEPLVEPNALPSLSADSAHEDGQHALAWSYLRTGAAAKADALLSHLWRQCQADEGEISRDSNILHYCAETELFRDEVDQALALFERAVAAGWRNYYLRQHDPYWASLEGNPRYRALMTKVKADVDRQHAEVARIDAGEDFIAKLDAVQAARAGTER